MNKLNISIPSKVDNIHMVESFIESFTTTFNLPSKLLGRINLAVIGAFNNAVSHGNSGDITKKVTVVAEKVNNQLKVTVSDEGEGFDYTIIPDPTSLENNEESKRGLFLMKELSDELIFENNGATVTMIFHLKLNLLSKLLEYLRTTKIGELIKRKESSTIKQLEISIPSKLDHVVKIEDFVYSLPKQLDIHGLLFYRIKVVILEAINHIITVNKREDKDIKVVVIKMKKKIKVTISCGEKTDDHRFSTPLPSHKLDLQVRMLFSQLYFMEHFPDKIFFSKEGTEIVFFFRSSIKAKKNKRINL